MINVKEEDALQWIGTICWCIWNEDQVIDSISNTLTDWKNTKEIANINPDSNTRIVCRRCMGSAKNGQSKMQCGCLSQNARD